MTARVQQPGEAIMQYAVAKEKLLLMSPFTLTDQQKVQAMTVGLSDWKNQAWSLPISLSATTASPTATAGPITLFFSVDDLVARIERMAIVRLGPVRLGGDGAAAVPPAERGRGSDPGGRGRTGGGVCR